MKRGPRILFGILACTIFLGCLTLAQQRTVRSAPAAADWAALAKLPDFTGVWEAGGGGGGGGAAPRGGAAGAAAPATAAAPRGGGAAPAAAGRGGGGRGATGPQLTPAYAAKAAARTSANAEDNASANCVPPGVPQIMGQPYPMEFLFTPGLVTIVIEAYTQVRHIYTDGRKLPDDPEPNFHGTSIGHWEGNTLVAETVGFADTPRGITFPFSEKMKVVERFQLTDPDTMTIETTIVDPEALTAPYSMGSRSLRRHRNWTIAEYVCQENNRNFLDNNGKAGIILANPGGAPR
ncbi:MAG TPA: hypothetical protein VK210_06615 [Terriglobia bacterium]|nr:hypothetical protein [Terriglobia bacterium]